MISRIASFDIGKKNLAFYIEEFDIKLLHNLKKIPKNKRYNLDGSPTPDFDKLLIEVYQNGETILFQNVDITANCDKKSYLENEMFHNMTDIFDQYIEFWDTCDAFVVEKQMSFGKKHNTMALKLGQHCWSYFAFKYNRFKELVEFPAYHKTQVLGSAKTPKVGKGGKTTYKAIDKPARKKWCIQEAIKILELRNDIETLSIMTDRKKKDDLADVLCQLQAFKILTYIDKLL